jgi:plasmid stabilization system protein ParE
MQPSRANTRKTRRRTKRLPQSVASIASQPKRGQVKKRLCSFVTYNSSGTGSYIAVDDIVNLLTATADWTNMLSVYQLAKINKLTITWYPDAVFDIGNVGLTFFGSVCPMGYFPTTSAIATPSTICQTEHHVIYNSSEHQIRLSFKPIPVTGVTTFVPTTALTAAGFLGYLHTNAPAGTFNANVGIFYVEFAFDVDFAQGA